MTKSELIESVASKQKHLPAKDVELAIKHLLELMSETLAGGQRIEIRGFGSFSLHYRPPRTGRNPKTGEPVALAGKYVPHFKPGKDLRRERVNGGRHLPVRRLIRTRLAGAIFRSADAYFGLTIGGRPPCARSGCFSHYSWLY